MAMVKVVVLPALLCAALSSPAYAGGESSFTGAWKLKVADVEGEMFLGADGDLICGSYKTSGEGWINGKVKDGKLQGLWYEGPESEGGYALTASGKGIAGRYGLAKDKQQTDDPATDSWAGTKLALKVLHPAAKAKKLEIEWGGTEKLNVTLTIKGSAVTGKMVYRYSGEPGGTLKGTLTGNVLVGSWQDPPNADKDKVGSGRFQWTFAVNQVNAAPWSIVGGSYSFGNPNSCNDNGGKITGSWQ